MRSAILFIILSGSLAAQQAGINGVAVDAVTRQPMAGVHITLRPATAEGATPEDVYGAMSRADGHFSIAGMKPDIYFVAAQRNGYLFVPDRKSATITVAAAGTISDFVVQMTPHAVIVGHVFDEYGDPVQYARVEASSAGRVPTVGGAAPAALNDSTDERGQYRLVLPPGKYYVRAMPDPDRARIPMLNLPEIRGDGRTAPVYGPAYYPGTESKAQASVVQSVAGREVNGIDIRYVPQRSLTIHGVVTGLANPDAQAFGRVQSVGGDGNYFVDRVRLFTTGAGGVFMVTGLPAGRYVLRAEQQLDSILLESPSVDVQLDAEDATGVNLTLQPGEALDGTLEIEGGKADKMTIRLATPTSGAESKPAEIGEGGRFRIDGVFPGKFLVRVLPLPENAFIKSVKLDDTEAPDGVLDLSRGVGGARIKVRVSLNGGQVEGSVLDTDGEPLHSPVAFVELVTSADQIGRNTKTVPTGTKFRYTGLRPGKYRLVAVDARDFDFEVEGNEAMFSKAPEIEIREGDRITKNVKVLNAP